VGETARAAPQSRFLPAAPTGRVNNGRHVPGRPRKALEHLDLPPWLSSRFDDHRAGVIEA